MNAVSDSGLRKLACTRLLALACTLAAPACATELQLSVLAADKPVEDVVLSLHSVGAAAAVRPGLGVIDQRDTQFVPKVSVVTTGTPVRFPNSDNVRHQVYSFSPAKRFELPLYSGRTAPPVVFDAPGVVVLGCNIHDWMVAYLVVVDSPYYGITGAGGRLRIDAPAGTYTLRIWHPDLKGGEPIQQRIVLSGTSQQQAIALTLSKQVRPAAPADDKLRALQERFRKLKERN